MILRRRRTGVVRPAWNVAYAIVDRTVTGLTRGAAYSHGAARVGPLQLGGYAVEVGDSFKVFARAWDAAECFIRAAGGEIL